MFLNKLFPHFIDTNMNILIIKVGALGDVLRTNFIAQALKEKYMEQTPKIFWVTDLNAKPFFINNPYVYSLISNNNKERLKNIKFDLVINLEEDEESCKFASYFKHAKIIGFYYKDGMVVATPTAQEWFNMSALGKKPKNDILKKRNKKTHRQIVSEIIGIQNYKQYEPLLRLNKEQRKFAYGFLRRHTLSRTDLIVGINTGSADRWPKALSIKKTVELINLIYKKFNAKIILFGGPNEIQRNNEILRLSKAPVIVTGCGNNLFEFPALINVCNLFISTDTLGLHISLALKRKTIALIGPTSNSEIEMYGLGEKIVADSSCICCYKKDCKSMEKIDIHNILNSVSKLLKQKITLLITAYKEPNISKAIESALNQKTKYDYNIIVSAPDEETLRVVKQYSLKNKNISCLKDPGMGKSFALNMAFSKIKTDILILTDGDLILGENAIEEVTNLFLDPEIGCVSGRPVPCENNKTKYGFCANFLFDSAHRIRKKAFDSDSFIECSGYLFAFIKNKIDQIPIDVAEDTVIPYIFWQKGYRIGYAENAKVYVKNADNLSDWIKQKIRTHKSHRNLGLYVDINTTPKVKSFKTEIKGISWLIDYPSNLKESYWIAQLALARLYTWTKYFIDIRFFNETYIDGWERIESTKQ